MPSSFTTILWVWSLTICCPERKIVEWLVRSTNFVQTLFEDFLFVVLTIMEPVRLRHWSAHNLQVKSGSLSLRTFI